MFYLCSLAQKQDAHQADAFGGVQLFDNSDICRIIDGCFVVVCVFWGSQSQDPFCFQCTEDLGQVRNFPHAEKSLYRNPPPPPVHSYRPITPHHAKHHHTTYHRLWACCVLCGATWCTHLTAAFFDLGPPCAGGGGGLGSTHLRTGGGAPHNQLSHNSSYTMLHKAFLVKWLHQISVAFVASLVVVIKSPSRGDKTAASSSYPEGSGE